MTDLPRPAYLLMEATHLRRGQAYSSRAFYRLYVANYRLARQLGYPFKPLVRLNAWTRNPAKHVAVNLQWYLLVLEELLNSPFEGDGISPVVLRCIQRDLEAAERQVLEPLTQLGPVAQRMLHEVLRQVPESADSAVSVVKAGLFAQYVPLQVLDQQVWPQIQAIPEALIKRTWEVLHHPKKSFEYQWLSSQEIEKVFQAYHVRLRDVRPRQLFDELTVAATLDEASKVLSTSVNASHDDLGVLEEFRGFLTDLERFDSRLGLPVPLLSAQNGQLRLWVRDYQVRETTGANTLNPGNYGQRFRALDATISHLLGALLPTLQAQVQPDQGWQAVVLLLLIIPRLEYLAFVDYLDLRPLTTPLVGVAPQVIQSVLLFYLVVHPPYLKQFKATSAEEAEVVGQFQRTLMAVGKQFGFFKAGRLFPQSVELYNQLFSRLSPLEWLAQPQPSAKDLRQLSSALENQQNQFILEVTPTLRPRAGLGHDLFFTEALLNILQGGLHMLRAYELKLILHDYVLAALGALQNAPWDVVERSEAMQHLTRQWTAFMTEATTMTLQARDWLKETREVLSALSDAWHLRFEISAGHCVLDMNEDSSRHQQFIAQWKTVLVNLHLDAEVLDLLTTFFEGATRDRQQPAGGQLHSVATWPTSSALPPEPVQDGDDLATGEVKSTPTRQVVRQWHQAITLMRQAKARRDELEYAETTAVLAGLPPEDGFDDTP